MANSSPSSTLRFIINCALLAGKIIDRNMSPTKPSFAHVLDLDEQMVKLSVSMPDDWWKLSNEPEAYVDPDQDGLKERLILQFYFFHIRVYLHLPCIGQSSPDVSSQVSIFRCMEAARELLTRYNTFRSDNYGPCLFECKTADFIAFTAVTVLMTCISQASEKLSELHSSDDNDTNLINATENIFEKLEQKGSKIASQCRATLRFLSSGGTYNTDAEADPRQLNGIKIPYFGTIVKRPLQLKHPEHLFANRTLRRNSAPDRTTSSLGVSTIQEPPIVPMHPLGIECMLLNGSDPTLDYSSWNAGNISEGDIFPWLGTAMLDIDQDWAISQEIPFG
jgi:hypothetical protein